MGFQMKFALRILSLVLIGLVLCCSVLADIVILKDGYVAQIGTPKEIFDELVPMIQTIAKNEDKK